MKCIAMILAGTLFGVMLAAPTLAEDKKTTATPELKPGLVTFHIGNSLTGTAGRFGMYAKTAGYNHTQVSFIRGGALTKRLWENEVTKEKTSWEKTFGGLPKIDVFTIQPRDFNIAEEADYDVKFLDVVRQKSPEMQPWLYIEWVEKQRRRWSDQGAVPSSQMKVLWPAVTWQESMAAMLLYGEELQLKLRETYKEGKPIRVLPSGISMGWICDMIERGKVPGIDPKDYWVTFFGKDGVHPNANGAYLIDCTWYAAFYRESPEGKVAPVNTTWTPEQAKILQKLAWDVVKNYPDCGLYSPGKEPAGKPEFHINTEIPLRDITPVTLSSSTDGAWFRYTLDGTTPTPTRGYLYCGVISVRPGMTVKAIAFKDGMAPGEVHTMEFPAAQRTRELMHVSGIGMHNLELYLAGPFGQYVRHNGTQLPDSALSTQVLSVGAPGQTLWVSGTIRPGADNEATPELVLDSQTNNRRDPANSIAAGSDGKGHWRVRVGEKSASGEIAAEPGKLTRLVLELSFDADPDKPSRLSLFVVPVTGAELPAKPQATIAVPPHFEWRSVGFSADPKAKGDVGELHVGESFEAVAGKGK
jgi:hypothetical protein